MRKVPIVFFLIFHLTVASAASNDDAKKYFPNMDGCFLLYNMKSGGFEKIIGQERCQKRFSPCSTFKVPLALMAFDAGILNDEHEMLKWDGTHYERGVANHDHNAMTWMRDSIVWFSQRLTPRIGEARLKRYLHDFHYGNEDFSAGITEAWLVAPDSKREALKISAYEQVEFLKRLWTSQLNVAPRAIQITKEITYLETSPQGFKLNGKTGSNSSETNPKLRLGWFIAHLEKNGREYLAVTNFSDVAPPADASYGGVKAKEITKKILSDEGLW